MTSKYQVEIASYLEALSPISTHSHHLPDGRLAGMDLATLFTSSYVSWRGVPIGTTAAEHAAFLDKVRHTSSFVWLERSVQAIYGVEERIDTDNWSVISERIQAAHAGPEWHLRLLSEKCRYTGILLDCYWNPGDNNGHPDLFQPVFRIDPFLHAYDVEEKTHDSTSLVSLYGSHPFASLQELEDTLRTKISERKAAGCVGLKSAIAYERDVAFRTVNDSVAGKALRKGAAASSQEKRDFQDWVFFACCRIAAEEGLPFQVHTGLGQLEGTRAMGLREAIVANPATCFVLFHCSFPWTDDVLALLHNHPNVYPDLCWLPLLSTSTAVRTLRALIDTGTADKVCWGCDTWTGEESYGALLAARHVIARTLADLVQDDWLDMEAARHLGKNILHDNAARLYGVG